MAKEREPSSDVVIRPVEGANPPQSRERLHRLSQDGGRRVTVPERVTATHEQVLREINSNLRQHCLVLEAGGRIEGTLTVALLPDLSHGAAPVALVESVVVDQVMRGCGSGRRLMDEAEQIAREHGCYQVAPTSNRRRTAAHALYEPIGSGQTHTACTRYQPAGRSAIGGVVPAACGAGDRSRSGSVPSE